MKTDKGKRTESCATSTIRSEAWGVDVSMIYREGGKKNGKGRRGRRRGRRWRHWHRTANAHLRTLRPWTVCEGRGEGEGGNRTLERRQKREE